MENGPVILRVNSVNAVIPISIGIVVWIPWPEQLFQPGAVSGTAIFHAGAKAFSIPLAILLLRAKSRLIIPVGLSQLLIDDILVAVTNARILSKGKSVLVPVLKSMLAGIQRTPVIHILSHQ